MIKRSMRQLQRYVRCEYILALAVIVGCISLLLPFGVHGSSTPTSAKCTDEDPFCQVLTGDQTAATQLSAAERPAVKTPEWLSAIREAQTMVVTYEVTSQGNIRTNLEDFARAAAETFADSRGWSRLGVRFERVASGGQFTLVLSEASQMTTFSATGCDTMYSCRVGRYVIINEDRWLGATESWNAQGGSLRDYQHMVVNHETGHWLGHGHYNCTGPGQPAPVMQQQSMDLQGCTFNPWPVDFELTSSQLGI